MQPYYDHDGITIYHGDCLEILPALDQFDITVSSPPYNMIAAVKPSGILAEHQRKKSEGYLSHADDMSQDDYEAWMVEVFGRCMELSRGLVWINHKTRFVDKKARHPVRFFPWDLHGEIIWSRPGSTTLNAQRYAPSHEMILAFGVPHYWDRCNDTKLTVWNIPPETSIKGHPCPFPVVIPQRLITSSCPPNGIVLDPFMGSGTTLVAAKLEGRKAVGIELEERYCEIAANRLAQGVLF